MNDVYADQVSVNTNFYTISFSFGQADPNAAPAQQGFTPHTIVRMSPEHAKVFALVLRKSLKDRERSLGLEIVIPHDILNQSGVSIEDW